LFVVLGLVTVIGPASMDSYLPGLPDLARDFGVGASAAQVTLTTYLVGFALGQFLAGSLSDVHGRRPPLIAGMTLFTLASIVCAFTPNLYALASMRLVQGATAAAGVAIGRAVVRDLYSGAAAARYLSRLMLIVGLGPILAPMLGGELLRVTSWRGIFLVLALLGLALTVMAAWQLPETLAPHDRRAPGLAVTARTFKSLLADRRFVGFVLIVAFGSAGLIGYVAGSPFVLEEVYGASPQLYGALFAINACFLVGGAQINAHLLKTRSPSRLLGFGLTTMVVASATFLIVVLIPGAGIAAVLPPLTLLLFSWSFIQSNALALALTDHPDVAGTAASLLGVSQFALAAIVAPLVGIGGNDTALPMAIVITICAIGAGIAFRRLVSTVSHPLTPAVASPPTGSLP
jgi:DHA1 family bicyclomycin/chloramphenicol resistance-like MFS transporter